MEAPESQDPPPSIGRAVQQADSRHTFYSFGDDGVTATVDTSGCLLQMTRHFPGKQFKTGFCVDNPSVEEPYFVTDRIAKLLSRATDPYNMEAIDPAIDLNISFEDLQPPKFVHDRWPHFTITTDDGVVMATQYLVSDGTIFQKFEFDFSRSERPRDLPEVSAKKGLLIRDLDFISHANRFNEAGPDDPSYATEVSDQGFLVRSHSMGPEAKEENTVALFISAFSEKQCLKFEKKNDGDCQLQWSDDASSSFRTRGKFTITIAYTLKLLKLAFLESLLVNAPVSFQDCDSAMQKLQQECYEAQCFTNVPHIDFRLRRNLEHILSVCSIPVDPADKSETPAMALTCGDLDGHRVATVASFYCFQFLLLALAHFRSKDFESARPIEARLLYIRTMKERIEKVCKGHLEWLFFKAEKTGGLFSTHYWVNGAKITGGEDNNYLPGKSLVDAPFHIIKAGDFKDKDLLEGMRAKVEQAVSDWIEDLDKSNKMGLYAFPRCRKATTHSFYFTDHVLIWRAIKAAEELGLNLPHIPAVSEKRTQFDTTVSKRQHHKVRNYSSARVQQNILKRFTTENPLSRKRMIAVSRGPGQSRFLLRTRDATLFHVMEQGFFDRPGAKKCDDLWQNKVDVWRNTIDCQMRHEDNDDAGWNEPLRFALSIMMARNGKRMNARPVTEMHVHALSVLLQSSSPNGLFPGALDENNEPVMYDDELMRDTYWGITFEIPYILWKYCSQPPSAGTSNPTPQLATNDQASLVPTQPEFWMSLKEALEQQVAGKGMANPLGYSMKHSFPFNNVVYQENIVELSDEWLYNEPSFFVPERQRIQRAPPIMGPPELHFGAVVVDVPKSKHLKKKIPQLNKWMTEFTTTQAIEQRMLKGRSPEEAKKRFWAFFAKDPIENKICYHTSCSATSDDQRHGVETVDKEVSSFFEKHRTYDKFFLEETTPVLNSWTTELHLSFYEVGEKKAVANPTTTKVPHTGLLCLLDFEEEHSTQIARVSMSFRFNGDFFDRYWTCWWLEADPRMKTDYGTAKQVVEDLLEGEHRDKTGVDLKKAPWRQRRVLELLLFSRIICHMRTSADNILKLAKSSIRKKSKIPEDGSQEGLEEADDLDYNAFLATRRRFEQFQKVLQTVQGDLAENLTKVEQWLNREKERQAERPRWTFNDESRYRSVISKLNFSNDHDVQELRRSYAKIVSFNDLLAKKLEIMRNDVDQRRADDIQRFTWVTVFFLPMGFATGVFSMSGAPSGRTLWHMVVTMFGALFVTALLLIFSKSIEKLYDWGSGHVRDLGKKVFGLMHPAPASEVGKDDPPITWQDVVGRRGDLFSSEREGDLERGLSANSENLGLLTHVGGSQERLKARVIGNRARRSSY